jgi:Protein of unknown function (DUF3035)
MRSTTFAILMTSILALAGCSTLRGDKKAPDEFAVAREAPLVVPPDFALRPPRPGAPRPQEVDAQSQAMQALFGPAAVPARSPAEEALLSKAGAARSTADIRSTVKDDGTIVADKGAMLKEILSTESGKMTDGTSIGTAPPPSGKPKKK